MFFFCWLAAWGSSYRGTPGQLNHFDVITLHQQLHISYFPLYVSRNSPPPSRPSDLYLLIVGSQTQNVYSTKSITPRACTVWEHEPVYEVDPRRSRSKRRERQNFGSSTYLTYPPPSQIRSGVCNQSKSTVPGGQETYLTNFGLSFRLSDSARAWGDCLDQTAES